MSGIEAPDGVTDTQRAADVVAWQRKVTAAGETPGSELSLGDYAILTDRVTHAKFWVPLSALFGGGGTVWPEDLEFFVLDPPTINDVVVNPEGNRATVDWGPVTDAVGYEVEVIVDGGAPEPYAFPQATEVDINATSTSDYGISIRARGAGGISSARATLEVSLVDTPLFVEDTFEIGTAPELWFANEDATNMILHDIDTDRHYYEYSLSEAGVLTLIEDHVDTTSVGTLRPVKKNGNVMWVMREDTGTSEAGLMRYNLFTDSLLSETVLTLDNSGSNFIAWDEEVFASVTCNEFTEVVKVEAVLMSTGNKETLTMPGLSVNGVLMVDHFVYVIVTTDIGVDPTYIPTFGMYPIDVSDPENLVLHTIVPWDYSQASMIMSGPGWVVVKSNILDSFDTVMTLDLTDRTDPVVADLLLAGIEGKSVAGTVQSLGSRGVEDIIGSGQIASVVDGSIIVYSADTDVMSYYTVDISTPAARANLVAVPLASDPLAGVYGPIARLWSGQSIGMVWDEGFTKKWLTVSGVPPTTPAPA